MEIANEDVIGPCSPPSHGVDGEVVCCVRRIDYPGIIDRRSVDFSAFRSYQEDIRTTTMDIECQDRI